MVSRWGLLLVKWKDRVRGGLFGSVRGGDRIITWGFKSVFSMKIGFGRTYIK